MAVGAKAASNIDVTEAERVKFGRGPGSQSNGVGAKSATEADVSNAERIKFGTASGSASMPGAQDATPDEMTAAARLKFGENAAQARPGAQNAINTTAAERMKVRRKLSTSFLLPITSIIDTVSINCACRCL